MANTSARKRGGQPGNKNALKHGYYSPTFRENEAADLEEADGKEVDLSSEIKLMRVIIRRVFEQAENCARVDEWFMLLGSLGAASTRLAGLLRTQKLLDGGGSDVADALSQALREVTSELGKC